MFLVLVGDTNLPLLLEALGSLDAELARVHYALRNFAAWPSTDSDDLSCARAAIRRAFQTLRGMREMLVVSTPESYAARASALRARGIVVLLELAQLHHCSAALHLDATTFATVEEFAAHVLAEIGRSNAMWTGRSYDACAILRAEARFSEIGADPRVATVLSRGLVSANPHVRLTCATLRALLNDHEASIASSSQCCASSQEN